MMAAVDMLIFVVDIMAAIFLEKNTRKNSGNSGIPPSKDIGSRNDRNGNRKGKGKGKINGERLDNVRTAKSEETVSPKKCTDCGRDLEPVAVAGVETRKELDIFYEVREKSVHSECKQCPDCGTVTKGEFPEGMDGPLQYGTGVKVAAVNLLMVQMMSMERVREYLKGILGRGPSPGALLKYVAAVGMAVKPWEEEMIKKLLEAPVLYVDETSIRINGELYWIHTYGYGDITLQFLHPSRGREAIDEIGILEKYKGIIVHDCWSSYFSVEDVTHALCVAHLLRELRFVEQKTGYRWATRMKLLLKLAAARVRNREKKVLRKKDIERLERLYDGILAEGLAELPDFPEPTGKRGRTKHTDAQNLWMRLYQFKDAVLLFTKVAEVEATNNRAERDLRMTKVKQKVSGCFRTEQMGEHYCSITGYVKTMRNKGYSAMEAIAMALWGAIPIDSS